jgi:hypothetical protein
MKCPTCSEEVRPHERHCEACRTDCGFPNVRAAEQNDEKRALAGRVADAERQAGNNGTAPLLAKLRAAARRSRAVRVRSLDEVYALVKRDDTLMGNFYDLKGAGLLRPSATEMEAARQSAEPLVFLNYQEKIQFAALTLDDTALFTYGNCAMIFQEAKIANRATVFEENCVLFCQRRDFGPSRPKIPPGYRATWPQREDLVVAKLGPRLGVHMQESDLPSILISSGSDPSKDDFVEVHIYDRLHRSALDYVVVRSRRAADKALVRQMKADLGEDRVKVV